ncbi:hypothetical protein COCNU_scaffold017058G000010 [Cocos nucifera]|nr:hypothetical protein [Cocos nucifera]
MLKASLEPPTLPSNACNALLSSSLLFPAHLSFRSDLFRSRIAVRFPSSETNLSSPLNSPKASRKYTWQCGEAESRREGGQNQQTHRRVWGGGHTSTRKENRDCM